MYLCGESEIYYIYMTTELGVFSSYIPSTRTASVEHSRCHKKNKQTDSQTTTLSLQNSPNFVIFLIDFFFFLTFIFFEADAGAATGRAGCGHRAPPAAPGCPGPAPAPLLPVFPAHGRLLSHGAGPGHSESVFLSLEVHRNTYVRTGTSTGVRNDGYLEGFS